ncbi:MAG: AAA family ATPase, partial [Bacteroidetes bacterium QS_8_64_10]
MAEETATQTVRLQVAKARKQDAGKGAVRLSKEALRELGIQPERIIELKGKRKTVAVAAPPYAEDQGRNTARLDGLQRSNAGVSIGDHVEIRPAEVQPAETVTIAPAQKNMRLPGSGGELLRTLYQRPLTTGDLISTSVYQQRPGMDRGQFPEDIFRSFFQQRTFGLQEIRLVVTNTSPSGIVQVTEDTEMESPPEHSEPREGDAQTGVTYDDVGGLGDTIPRVREMIELPLKHPELFGRLGIDLPKGVLLHGPPGTGKRLLAKAVAAESDARFFSIAGPEVMGRYYGQSEKQLREVFEEAQQDAPSIIFIDELDDSISSKPDEATGEAERRVEEQLLSLMDGMEARENVI